MPSPRAEAAPPEVLSRPPGRPRDASCDRAILEATLELVAEGGLSRLTVDAVAAHAGVSKATLYRRWPSKEALLLDAWRECIQRPDPPDTGSLEGDLLAYLDANGTLATSALRDRVWPHLLAASRVDDGIRAAYGELVAQRRQPLREVVQRAVERGELPTGVDVELVLDLVVGPLVYRSAILGVETGRAVWERVVEVVLAGVRSTLA